MEDNCANIYTKYLLSTMGCLTLGKSLYWPINRTPWPATNPHKTLPILLILVFHLSLSPSHPKPKKKKKKKKKEEEEEGTALARVFGLYFYFIFLCLCFMFMLRYMSYLLFNLGLVGESSKGKEKKN